MPPPVITFLSDYGLVDDFVGVCHAVMAGLCPECRIIDLTHGVPRHDVTAGALITNDPILRERISFQQNAEGAGLSPFESWLLLRGIKTLALRVERQNSSALKIAEYLHRHPLVRNVYYPGLESHPGYELNRRQAKGAGAVISFLTDDVELSTNIVEATRLFKIAVSFGSVGSVISLPCRMSHASIPPSLKNRFAPPEHLVRLSVGIEDVGDLIDDLDQAFSVAMESRIRVGVAAGVG